MPEQRLEVVRDNQRGLLPLYASHDWRIVQPDIERVLVVVHGRLRNADDYFASGLKTVQAADAAAHTMLLAPQFMHHGDATGQPSTSTEPLLYWQGEQWMGGAPSANFIAISSFDALDALLGQLTDRTRFPHLRQVVLAGHSGGAQLVQRYAVVGHGDAVLAQSGIALRYVIANPSTYLYFNTERPAPDPIACPGFNQWKYGGDQAPPYVSQPLREYEKAYAARDVIYLLGDADVDPHHPALDRSCAARTQGGNRWERGLGYVRYLQSRHPDGLHHRLLIVAGIGHDGARMLNSACGLAALFDRAGCATDSRSAPPK